MWGATINCERCGTSHSVYSELESLPRAFAYECPVAKERVELRFRDPSVMVEPWTELERVPDGALPTLADEADGSFDL